MNDFSFEAISKKSLNKSRKRKSNISVILPRISTV